MIKHTPGPWKVNKQFVSGVSIESMNGRIVFLNNHVECEGKPCGSISSQDKSQEEINANAQLISAAPDLLAACKILTEQYNSSADIRMGGNLTNEGFLKANKAINKVEGE